MNDALRMQISAFVDGELPENESELLLRRLSQDAELRQLVDEYMGIGRLMRREPAVPGIGSLRSRIAEALGEEIEVQPVVAEDTAPRYLKPIAGFAVAASVALVAIFALQQSGTPRPDTADAVADSALQAPLDDQILDEMFRHHGAGDRSQAIGELATYDFAESDGVVEVQPRAQLVAPVEFSNDAEEDDEEQDEESPDEMTETK